MNAMQGINDDCLSLDLYGSEQMLSSEKIIRSRVEGRRRSRERTKAKWRDARRLASLAIERYEKELELLL